MKYLLLSLLLLTSCRQEPSVYTSSAGNMKVTCKEDGSREFCKFSTKGGHEFCTYSHGTKVVIPCDFYGDL